MYIKKAPCFECKNRELGCHSNCEKYKEWKVYQYNAKKKKNLQINPRCATYFKERVTEYGVYRSKKKYR